MYGTMLLVGTKCNICTGKGIILRPATSKGKHPYLTLCDCIQEKCATCQGDHELPYIFYDTSKGVMRSCPCAFARYNYLKVEKIFANSNIPLKFRYHRLREFRTDSENEAEKANLLVALDTARQVIDQFHNPQGERRGLYLFGPTGTGKTFLACLILNEIIFQFGIEAKYVKITRDFFNRIRNTFNQESGEYGRTEVIFQELATVEVIVLDDFGIQADSPWEQRILYDLLDVRYENEKVTIITSNLTPEEIRRPDFRSANSLALQETVTLYQRIFSRLKEMTDFQELITRDYRDNFAR